MTGRYILNELPMRGEDLDRLANPSLKKIGGARGGREREKDNNPSNWLAVFASLNYVILRIPRETRNSGIKENPWWLRVCVCERSSPFTLSSIDSNRIRSLNVGRHSSLYSDEKLLGWVGWSQADH